MNLGTLLGGTGGSLDFAGGSVVHISSGVSALAASLVLGKRHKEERGEGILIWAVSKVRVEKVSMVAGCFGLG